MINQVPFYEVQQSIYELFSTAVVGYPIIDDSAPLEEGKPPADHFGLIGAITSSPRGNKVDTLIWDVVVHIELYSSYGGKKQVNSMVNDVVLTLTAGQLTMPSFRELDVQIEEVECRAEDWEDSTIWQHGTVRASFKLEQKGV